MSGENPARLCTLLVLVSASAGLARASATLLLEEPYGKLGFFTATGHAAVYLSGVCAETPLVLRPCAPGELGAVISRYDGVGGYDWVAIPLIPYLYAVEQPDDIPLFVDPKMVSFLRDQYRRKHLEAVAPDRDNGATPSGNWYELVGSAYDRTMYAFEIETTSAQDQAFIDKYNSSPNRSHFRTVSSNCADFAKDVINFYYPKSPAPQRHRRCRNHHAQADGEDHAQVQRPPSPIAVLAFCDPADSGQHSPQHSGAWSGRILPQIEEVHGSQRRGESDFCGLRGGRLCGHGRRPL